eukprot:03912_2
MGISRSEEAAFAMLGTTVLCRSHILISVTHIAPHRAVSREIQLIFLSGKLRMSWQYRKLTRLDAFLMQHTDACLVKYQEHQKCTLSMPTLTSSKSPCASLMRMQLVLRVPL